MATPIDAGDIRSLDAVLCSHKHSDHMDPGTLSVLAKKNLNSKFIFPRAEFEYACKLGFSNKSLCALNAGESLNISNEIFVEAIASAHEQLLTNNKGENFFLGYILKIGKLTLYHSGDCIQYLGLNGILAEKNIDIAMLPINGRNEQCRKSDISGNFTIDESIALCKAAKIPTLIMHHFGMFAFNTVDASTICQNSLSESSNIKLMPAQLKTTYKIRVH